MWILAFDQCPVMFAPQQLKIVVHLLLGNFCASFSIDIKIDTAQDGFQNWVEALVRELLIVSVALAGHLWFTDPLHSLAHTIQTNSASKHIRLTNSINQLVYKRLCTTSGVFEAPHSPADIGIDVIAVHGVAFGV